MYYVNAIPEEKLRVASDGLHAIAHELRLSVLCRLTGGPMCVAELMKETGASQSNLSQHLALMRMAGIVEKEKRGQHVYYRITNPAFADLVLALRHIYPGTCSSAEES